MLRAHHELNYSDYQEAQSLHKPQEDCQVSDHCCSAQTQKDHICK